MPCFVASALPICVWHGATFWRYYLDIVVEYPPDDATIMVSRICRGRHVLPHQTLRPTVLPPGRREPLARRPLPATRPRDAGPVGSPSTIWPTRRPARLRSTLRAAGPAPDRPPPGAMPGRPRPPPGRGARLRAALA